MLLHAARNEPCHNIPPCVNSDFNRKCVKEWEEPHDSTLYCIQTDGNHMIASGSSYYGVVRLWDKRQSKCLQVWTVYPRKQINMLEPDSVRNKRNAKMIFFLLFVQSFQLCSNPVTSPVYCLRFSSSHLYAALANALQTLDFSQNRIYIS